MTANMHGKLFIISAPSGGGKTSLSKALIEKLEESPSLSKVTTYTTRLPRSSEIDGIDYHFVSSENFQNLKKQNFFIETSRYHDNWYGSPISIIDEMKKGKSFVIATDRPGVKSIKKIIPQAIFIWITIASIEELENRMKKREQQSEHHIQERLALAQQELEEEEREKLADYVVVNDNFDRALHDLKKIVTTAISSLPILPNKKA